MAAALADGETVLENAAREPEVTDLARSARDDGREDRRYRHGPHRDRRRRQAAWRAALGHARPHRSGHVPVRGRRCWRRRDAASCGSVDRSTRCIESCARRACSIEDSGDSMRVKMASAPEAVSFRTPEYPAFPDRHAGAVHGAQCDRRRHRRRSPRRSSRTASCTCRNCTRLGASIDHRRQYGARRGRRELSGAKVMATDLRASASLVIAATVRGRRHAWSTASITSTAATSAWKRS